jgi:hypothetical protein
MRNGADGEARHIAETVAQALAGHGSPHGPLRIEIQGGGRPARHMANDIAGTATHAVRAGARREV